MSRLVMSSKSLEKTMEYTELPSDREQTIQSEENDDIFANETTPLTESLPNYGAPESK